ncbi:MAG: hypothetical protein AAF662_01335 [Pseudomonadota bacterium]
MRSLIVIVLLGVFSSTSLSAENLPLGVAFEIHMLERMGEVFENDESLRMKYEEKSGVDWRESVKLASQITLNAALERAASEADPEAYYSELGFEVRSPYLGDTSLESYALLTWAFLLVVQTNGESDDAT